MDLIKANGIEPQAQVQKSNGDPIQNAKPSNSLLIQRFVFKESHTQCHMKGTKGD